MSSHSSGTLPEPSRGTGRLVLAEPAGRGYHSSRLVGVSGDGSDLPPRVRTLLDQDQRPDPDRVSVNLATETEIVRLLNVNLPVGSHQGDGGGDHLRVDRLVSLADSQRPTLDRLDRGGDLGALARLAEAERGTRVLAPDAGVILGVCGAEHLHGVNGRDRGRDRRDVDAVDTAHVHSA